MPVIFLVVSFFIMIAAVGKIYKKIWSRNLDVFLSFQPVPAREGDKGVLTEVIKNNKRFPIPLLHVKFVTSKYLKFSEEDSAVVSDLTYKNDVFALMPYQQIKRTLTFECKKRGYFHIDKAEVISSFLFFSDFQYDKIQVLLTFRSLTAF